MAAQANETRTSKNTTNEKEKKIMTVPLYTYTMLASNSHFCRLIRCEKDSIEALLQSATVTCNTVV